MKTNLGDLEDEARKNFPGRPRNELTILVEEFYDKRGFLERFKDG